MLPDPELVPRLRRAGPADAEAVAEVYLTSFRATLPTVALVHPDDETRSWIRDVVIPELETWVVEDGDGQLVGFMALDDGMIAQLYLHPAWTGRGIGSRLVALAKERRPGGLELFTFQVNHGARRFYERHGFVVVDMDDGQRNENREPEVLYRWAPAAARS